MTFNPVKPTAPSVAMKPAAVLATATALLAAAAPGAASASELVYQPINPSFGGNPFNSSHLQGLAASQNLYRPSATSARNPSQDFANRIQSAVLSRVAAQVADRILGEGGADSGTFRVDSTEINFQRTGEVVVIDIFDGATGGKTQIEIPAPVF